MPLLFLTACASATDPKGLAINEPDARKVAVTRTIAPACPSPTAKGRLAKIEAELEAAIKAGSPPNALAAEWERLDSAARICRGVK